ncbi:hypothetical protein [Leptospira stimsonii]|uniref:Uncharacterized protein n=1 Tax=Leptospira stimsonii TaxID=2202203 RepID=A0ABY2NB94_9LEPT|nr:hypothetical protein [Leptospira stimsonii]TGK10366.1 hypothetical protein EHO98_22910 [Leptospira stimsonii]TGM20454.1 hypothetical protein EHQ90_02595 [Leptospira stimsonii]
MSVNEEGEPIIVELADWFQALRSKIRRMRAFYTLLDWDTGSLIIQNHWTLYYNGFPFLLLQGSYNNSSKYWQFRFGLLGFVLVVFNERTGEKAIGTEDLSNKIAQLVFWFAISLVTPITIGMLIYIYAAFACSPGGDSEACRLLEY